MNLIKRVISMAICAIILFLSPVSVYFSANNILTVHASGPIALTAEAIYVLCQYLGSLGMAYAPVQRPDLPTDEEVLEFGYNVLVELSDLMFPATLPEEKYGNGSIVIYDSSGIPYVYGSEALQEAAETEFTVIQGARNPDDDNNNDDDDESKKTGNHLLECWRAGELFVAGSVALGDCITDIIYDAYSNYINGEPSLYDDVLANLGEQAFTSADYEAQWAGDYNLKLGISSSDVYTDPYSSKAITRSYRYSFDLTASVPRALVFYKNPATTSDGTVTGYSCHYQFLEKDARYGSSFCKLDGTLESVIDGVYGSNAVSVKTIDWNYSLSTDYGSVTNFNTVYNANIPVFGSYEDAKAYLIGELDYTNALNYAKTYQEADWLAEDWAGKLIDPLTGLNALSNFSNIARHQGLNALGNELTPDDYVDYLRDYFANLGTDKLPEVDPAVAPIVFSGEMPAITIDPTRNPVIQPVSDPSTNPGTNPGTNPDPGTGIDPGTDPTPDTSIEDTITQTKPFFGGLSGELKNKFPFSIPWDLIAVFTLFQAEPETPRIEVPFIIESLGIEESIVIDLSGYGLLSRISRSLMAVLFVLGLIKMTPTMLSFGKDL